MELLLAVPEALGCRILVDWFDLRSVVLLDQSYLSHASRGQFLALLRSRPSEHVERKTAEKYPEDLHIKYCEWLMARSMKISGVLLPTEAPAWLIRRIKKFTQECCPKLTELQFSWFFYRLGEISDVVHVVLPCCHNLLSLSVEGFENCCCASFWHDVTRYCPHLRTLTLNFFGINWFCPDTIREEWPAFPLLRSLELLQFEVTSDFIDVLVRAAPQLQELRLGNSIFESSTSSTNTALPVVWSGLTLLHVPDGMPEDLVIHLLQTNHNLTTMTMRSTDHMLAALAVRGGTLTELVSLPTIETTDAGMSAFLRHCPQLTHLDISCNETYTAVTYRDIAAYCKQIAHLDVTDCNISGGELLALVQACKELREIRITKRKRSPEHPDKEYVELMDFCEEMRIVVVEGTFDSVSDSYV